MKIKIFHVALWALLSVVLVAASLAFSQPVRLSQQNIATPTVMSTVQPETVEARQDVGSTDGIALMSIIIVLIVILPILFQHQAWSNGKRTK